MTNTALHLPRGKYPPFLPRNYDEAPQYSAHRPATAITLPLLTPRITEPAAIPSQSSPVKPRTNRKRSAAPQGERERQTRADEIHGRLDNLYLQYETYIANNSDGPASNPFDDCGTSTQTIIEPAPSVKAAKPAAKKGRGQPKKVAANRLKPYLQEFTYPHDALSALPMFDDIVTGAVNLDAGGNTRNLSKSVMVSLLQGLDEISTEAIQEATSQSKRHCQRIGQYLRIIERTGFKVAQTYWDTPLELDWSGLE
jgi:hypothetical protein